MKTARKPVAKKTYAVRQGAKAAHWWMTTEDRGRMERLKSLCANDGLMLPSSAVVIRAGLILLERHLERLVSA
jgi:hypothetical protein